jgi:putative addiction module killer protein
MKYKIEKTNVFDSWLNKLKDKTVVNRIMARLYRVEYGNFGDVKSVGQNLFELRFFFGSGYRVYYTIKGEKIILLLCGGDKSSQKQDIARAITIMDKLEQEQ